MPDDCIDEGIRYASRFDTLVFIPNMVSVFMCHVFWDFGVDIIFTMITMCVPVHECALGDDNGAKMISVFPLLLSLGTTKNIRRGMRSSAAYACLVALSQLP